MNILNKEELRRQIREGKEISLDGILDEFKSLLRESLQTASEEELTSHLGYDKHQESDNPNYRNGHNKKSLKICVCTLFEKIWLSRFFITPKQH